MRIGILPLIYQSSLADWQMPNKRKDIGINLIYLDFIIDKND